MSYSQWKIPQISTPPPELLEAGYSPLLAAILKARGYGEKDRADDFIKSGESSLADPLLMTDMSAAVRRIEAAVSEGEKVAVFGDYDVDGITSSCLMADYLRSKGLSCEIYIPSRLEEGYGLNIRAVEALASRGVTLIITVDCGVTALEEADFAAALGVDMIITDHHECREHLPKAVAVIDPKRPGCGYPNRDLAGVGVAFKLLCAVEGSHEELFARYADIVAVGTIADVMPLVGENRYIIHRGLEKLREDPRPGLRALIRESGLNMGRISASNVGFTLAPRINAAGRLGSVEVATGLLLSENSVEADAFAADLCNLNRQRQELEAGIWLDATGKLSGLPAGEPIVLAREGWHQGVIGISASKLTEEYKVPAVMICLDGDFGKGSCRSYGGFNLYEALQHCTDTLSGFGGHTLAAGLTITRENIPAFKKAFCEYYAQNPPAQEPALDIDLCVEDPEMLAMKCVEELELLEPCGNGNPRAQVCVLGAVLEDVTPIGNGRHLKLKIRKFGSTYDAVYFSKTQAELGSSRGDLIDLAFCPQINEFRSKRSVQLFVIDLKPHDGGEVARVLTGDIPEAKKPSRDDFIRIWRSLQSRGGRMLGRAGNVIEKIDPLMHETRLAICLKVFEELELISLGFDGATLRLEIMEKPGKADLDSSHILASLS